MPSPAEWLRRALDDNCLTQKELAAVLGVQQQIVNRIALGKQGISAAFAKDLGAVFGVEPEFILRLQKEHEIREELARSRPANPEVVDKAKGVLARARIEANYPIREMIKRGWISDDRDALERQLARLGVAQEGSAAPVRHAAKKTAPGTPLTPSQEMWLLRVKEIAEDILVPRKYTAAAGREAEGKLKSLLASAEEARKVPRILNECGIRYVMVESLVGSKIDGVCFWLNESAPVIGMSCRFDRIDNFWFVLRHELEHVLQRHGIDADMIDIELEGERAGVGAGVADEERIANEAAAEFCVPKKAMDSFIQRKQPFFSEQDLIGFSRVKQIHPGIVAGQLQHRTGRYDRFREHQVKIRSVVAPGAYVDGWGDVYPIDE